MRVHRRSKGSRFAALPRRQLPGRGGRLILLIAAGAAVGTAAGFQIAAVIDRAGFGLPSGAAVPGPLDAAGEKPREEDRAMGSALAAAMRAESPTDCLTLEPRYRSGCRDFVEDRANESAMLPAPELSETNGSGGRASRTDWPAELD